MDRPDTVGYLPNYFTFSLISNFILPGFYFFYKDKLNNNKVLKTVVLFLISVILIAGGNKGLIVYFYIFIWVYEFKLKINFKLILMFISLFWVYLVLKTGELIFSLNTIEYNITSPLRRFFVSQGSGFIGRIHLISENFNFENSEAIKSYVYQAIYGVAGGSSPTYFLGDLIVNYGVVIGTAFHFFIICTLIMLSRYIDTNYKYNLFIVWNFFVVLYLLGMAEISEAFVFRLSAIMMNLIIMVFLIRIKK